MTFAEQIIRSSRPSIGRRLRRIIASRCLQFLFATLPIACFSAYWSLPVWLILATAAGLCLAPLGEVASWLLRGWVPRAAIVFLTWAGLSVLWSSETALPLFFGLCGLAGLGLLFVAAMRALPGELRNGLRKAARIGLILGTLTLIIHIVLVPPLAAETFLFGGAEAVRVSTALLLVVGWPLLRAALGRAADEGLFWALASGGFLLAVVAGAIRFEAYTILFALIAAGLSFLLAAWRARLGAALLASGVFVYLAGAPYLHIWPWTEVFANAGVVLPIAWIEQLTVWRASSGQIFESPVIGLGLGASEVPEVGLAALAPLGVGPEATNVVLTIWSELGVVGIVLAAAIFLGPFMAIWSRRAGGLTACIWSAAYVSCFVLGVTAFGGWDPLWFGALVVIAGTLAALRSTPANVWVMQPSLMQK